MYSARIILDSIGPNDARLTTFELSYPRFIHAELMTHRMFSRNSASSRAIPTEKLLSRIENDPALPVWWGKNQAGMQAKEELDAETKSEVKRKWLQGSELMTALARDLNQLGLHKQIANRIVEPWMFITVLLTTTELDNYWGLRVDPEAQPELEHVSSLALDVYQSSKPRRLTEGEWHLPLVTGYDEIELRSIGFDNLDLCKISTGRCARTSYLTHEGKREPEADIALAWERLRRNGHMSPFEHVAQAMSTEQWEYYAKHLAQRWIKERIPVGNFWGWCQFRKSLYNEHNFMLIKEEMKGGT